MYNYCGKYVWVIESMFSLAFDKSKTDLLGHRNSENKGQITGNGIQTIESHEFGSET